MADERWPVAGSQHRGAELRVPRPGALDLAGAAPRTYGGFFRSAGEHSARARTADPGINGQSPGQPTAGLVVDRKDVQLGRTDRLVPPGSQELVESPRY